MNEENNKKRLNIISENKNHISFSEIINWYYCSYRHKLMYIDKINLKKPSEFLDYGSIIHSSCGDYIKTRNMNKEIAIDKIKESWKKNNFPNLDEWVDSANNTLTEFPKFLDKTFPNWEHFSVEELLKESIIKEDNGLNFKGYIDTVIKSNNKWWIIDYKTCSWGWDARKKSSFINKSQLMLYKIYWCCKHNIDFSDVNCGFVLLKRTGKENHLCEFVKVYMGKRSQERVEKTIKNMVFSVKNKIFIKNRNSCKFCDYNETKYCV